MPETRVAIIGAGFGGIEVAKGLTSAPVRATLIDRHNYQLFQPLLYQVAAAALSPADIAEPVRRILRGRTNLETLLGEVTGINAADRSVSLADGSKLPYDVLVIATGAAVSYFGHPEWRSFAPGLKAISDGRLIRSRLLEALEQAEATQLSSERQRLTTFVIVGGGPSGVELAGSMAEFVRHSLTGEFRNIDPTAATIVLVEKGPHILADFPEPLSDYALRKLTALGVKVQTDCTVKQLGEDFVETDQGKIPVALAIWTAGVEASPVGKFLGAPTDKRGRIRVNSDLSIPGFADVYALGDVALFVDRDGNPLPGLAQVAKQQGKYLGRALTARLRYGRASKAFEFRNRGNVAVIGRHAAVVDFGWMRLTGILAWVLWAAIHIYFLAGLQHRLLVTVQWLWRYLTYERAARIIIEPITEHRGDNPC